MIQYIIVGAYFGVLGMLMVYCLHRCWILAVYVRHRHAKPVNHAVSDSLPAVTVQLPVYNEMYVVERLIDAVAALDYPAELLNIQVLDDSTDETAGIARSRVEYYAARGVDIVYLHRSERSGFKAGALQNGLATAAGELIAVFDADFIPSRAFLRQLVPYFSDDRVGMVQSRWGHVNRDYCMLTRLQAMFLDGHFILEHTARNRSGRFFNFNGTAGIWRRACIDAAGGWRCATLTEDLDLSYRAQAGGWKFVFVPDVVTPAEIPVDVLSFKSQQHRWAKGGLQTARLILPKLLKSSLPLRVKIEAFFHLTANANYLLLILLALLTYPALVTRIVMGWRGLLVVDMVCFVFSVLPITVFYLVSQRAAGENVLQRLPCIPLLMVLGIGLGVNNGSAVMEALSGRTSEFIRTPKFNIASRTDSRRSKKYRATAPFRQILMELLLGLYCCWGLAFSLQYGVYVSVPFQLLFCCGFLYVGCLSLLQYSEQVR